MAVLSVLLHFVISKKHFSTFSIATSLVLQVTNYDGLRNAAAAL